MSAMEEPRSVGEALAQAATNRERLDEPDESMLDAEASEPVEEPVEERPERIEERPEAPEAQEDEELEAAVEDVGYDPSTEHSAEVEHGMDELRAALGLSEPVEPAPVEGMPARLEQPAAPTLDDLRAFLLNPPEGAVAVDLGPMTKLGKREIPAYLLELQRRGYIRSWE